MVVVNWTRWAVLDNVLDVLNQIFFDSWLVEKIRKQNDTVDADFLSMFGQLIHFGDWTGNAEHHCDSVLAAHFQPFLSQMLALFNAKASSFTSDSIHQDSLNSFRVQVMSIAFDNIVVDGFSIDIWKIN